MLQRIVLGGLVIFWATMTVLLWRSEYGGASRGSAVPVSAVWTRMLRAPDNSDLEIRHRGKRIGACHWTVRVDQELPEGMVLRPEAAEGRVDYISGYTIDFDGDLYAGEDKRLWRFNFSMNCSSNHHWQELILRITQRPLIWQINASAPQQTLRVRAGDSEDPWERTFSFAELRQPEQWLPELAGPWTLGLLAGGLSPQKMENLSLGLQWQARSDWLRIGSSRLRVYRLQAQLLDRYQVVIYINRLGEILRAELPHDIVLINEAFLF